MNQQLKALWNYRGFILGSVQREFQEKYRNSLLGALWTVLGPLSNILIYTVIFSQIMKSRLPGVERSFAYGIYLCAGVVLWGLFVEIVTRCQTVFLAHANLIKKLNFPKICLPIIVTLNALVNFAIIFLLFLLFLLVTHSLPGKAILYTPLLVLLVIVMACGLGIFLGVLHVFFRDVGQLLNIVLQFWFWFTPVVYPMSILSVRVKAWVAYNPMTALIQSMQNIYLFDRAPIWGDLLYPGLLALVFALLALRLFRSKAGEIVDEL